MKLLKVFTCGGCGNSKFDSEFDEKGWCLKDSRGERCSDEIQCRSF